MARGAEDSQRSEDTQEGTPAQRRLSMRRSARIRELEDQMERYRQAVEDALQQLDWCIGYLHGSGKTAIAQTLSKNRAFIRTHLLKRPEEPVPSQVTDET
jgi:ribosome-binding protein aMBF1 (putative translation factor)